MRRLLTLTVSIIALLALTSKAAAHDWTGVARCESGGNWHLYTGNGYEGGLQFLNSTWLANGGGRYAQHAHWASPWQQVVIAERVLARYGWRSQWPVCGRYLR
jgi:hypothetical protein